MENTRPPGRAGRPEPGILLDLPGIRITDRWLTIADRRYPITELRDLRTLRGHHHSATVRAALATGAGLVVLAVTATALPAIGLLAAATAVLLLALVTGVCAWRNPRGHTLWADHRGLTLQLYYSDDQRVFGHICRTLVRARERAFDEPLPNPPHRPRHAPAAAVPHPSTLRPGSIAAEQAHAAFTRTG